MPTYVYECKSCSQTFEAEQRMSDAPLTACGCGAEGTVKRVMQPMAVLFKGSGFYVTDSAAPAPAATCNPGGTCSAPGCPSNPDA
ncbi:MAG: hypothetical protein MH204_00735 [Fimbriimonadaceae bacterium]|nr:hypothetical protein [Fimbriimonadaceae bacterium]